MGVADVTSFAKLSMTGRDAARVLTRLCANDVDVAPGRLVYTQVRGWEEGRGEGGQLEGGASLGGLAGRSCIAPPPVYRLLPLTLPLLRPRQMCNSRGGIEADVTVTRLGPEEFLVVSPTAQASRPCLPARPPSSSLLSHPSPPACVRAGHEGRALDAARRAAWRGGGRV